jgi:hypothetical protein
MKIEKCPFCGGEARHFGSSGQHSIRCVRCGTTKKYVETGDTPQSAYEAYDKAIAAWNSRAQPENKPLTLDALREMDGEPVWIVTLDGTDEPRWEIIVSAGKYGIDLICVLNGVETRDYAEFDLYNGTWLAYRYKPERSEG